MFDDAVTMFTAGFPIAAHRVSPCAGGGEIENFRRRRWRKFSNAAIEGRVARRGERREKREPLSAELVAQSHERTFEAAVVALQVEHHRVRHEHTVLRAPTAGAWCAAQDTQTVFPASAARPAFTPAV